MRGRDAGGLTFIDAQYGNWGGVVGGSSGSDDARFLAYETDVVALGQGVGVESGTLFAREGGVTRCGATSQGRVD